MHATHGIAPDAKELAGTWICERLVEGLCGRPGLPQYVIAPRPPIREVVFFYSVVQGGS